MLNKNRWKLIISSLVILLPVVFGLVFWQDLPATMTTHWSASGTPDGASSRSFSVFALPGILLLFHWLLLFFLKKDPNNNRQHRKVFDLMYWMLPVISLCINGAMYAVAMDREFSPLTLIALMMGIMFIAIGNYMPKCKQNSTLGVKIKWTLQSEENWNATHRLTGKVWVACGLAMLAAMLLPEKAFIAVMLIVMAVMIAVPFIYSYLYYRKQVQKGETNFKPLWKSPAEKKIAIGSLIAVTLILAFCAVIMFVGDIEITCSETSMTIEATFWQDLTVDYAAIDSVEYREDGVPGSRVAGFGSARLLLGSFRNDDFGNYTRYTYTKGACVVVNANGYILVIGCADDQQTQALYDTISARITPAE